MGDVLLPADVAYRAGCLPTAHVPAVLDDGAGAVLLSLTVGPAGEQGAVVCHLHDYRCREAHDVGAVLASDCFLPLSDPDTLAAVCRAMAARLGHTGAQVYWLMLYVDNWMLCYEDNWRVAYAGSFDDIPADTPAEAAMAILTQWAEEDGDE